MHLHQTNNAEKPKIVIIGGGIAGLTTAFRLRQAGVQFKLLEQSSQTGGCIKTLKQKDYLLELGPNTFLNSSDSLWNLAENLNLREKRISTSPAISNKRYIYKNGRLIKVPNGPYILFSNLFSLKGRLRMMAEPFIKPSKDKKDESMASFFERRFGHEVLDTLVTPFVSGIYAGDPSRLSINTIFPKITSLEEKYGSIFKGMKELKGEIKSKGLGSFTEGIGLISQTIENIIKDSIIYNARTVNIEKMPRGYKITCQSNGNTQDFLADVIICAAPAYSTSGFIKSIDANLSNQLSRIEYAPIIVIHTAYKKTDFTKKMEGFGFLVPRGQKVRMLGSLWSSSLFVNRAPEDEMLFTNFIGGMLDKEACDMSNEDLMRTLQKDLAKIVGIKTNPSFACLTRYSCAIPQLNLGHKRLISEIKDLSLTYQGLYLTGSYFNGVSVANTIDHANETAKEVLGFIKH
jgi:oxygen-dependent protoporphyrinogen oxidase